MPAEWKGVFVAKILVVDDETEITELLRTRLEHQGYEVVMAHDGVQALSKARTEAPDLILLDVAMPPPNGFQVCRTLKDDKALRHIPVILLTCKSTESDKFWGTESGADAYETKPFNYESLLERIQELLPPK